MTMTGSATHVFTGHRRLGRCSDERPKQKSEVISMGCRLNLAESNALAEQLAEPRRYHHHKQLRGHQ